VAIYHIEIASHSFAMTSINSIRLNAIWYQKAARKWFGKNSQGAAPVGFSAAPQSRR